MPGSGWNAAVLARLTTAPWPRSTMLGRTGVGEVDDGADVEPNLLGDASLVGLRERPVGGEARVVDQCVHDQAVLRDPLVEPGGCTGHGQIGRQHGRVAPMLSTDALGQRLQPIRATRHEDDVGSP
jgi:hypothetical protein